MTAESAPQGPQEHDLGSSRLSAGNMPSKSLNDFEQADGGAGNVHGGAHPDLADFAPVPPSYAAVETEPGAIPAGTVAGDDGGTADRETGVTETGNVGSALVVSGKVLQPAVTTGDKAEERPQVHRVIPINVTSGQEGSQGGAHAAESTTTFVPDPSAEAWFSGGVPGANPARVSGGAKKEAQPGGSSDAEVSSGPEGAEATPNTDDPDLRVVLDGVMKAVQGLTGALGEQNDATKAAAKAAAEQADALLAARQGVDRAAEMAGITAQRGEDLAGLLQAPTPEQVVGSIVYDSDPAKDAAARAADLQAYEEGLGNFAKPIQRPRPVGRPFEKGHAVHPQSLGDMTWRERGQWLGRKIGNGLWKPMELFVSEKYNPQQRAHRKKLHREDPLVIASVENANNFYAELRKTPAEMRAAGGWRRGKSAGLRHAWKTYAAAMRAERDLRVKRKPKEGEHHTQDGEQAVWARHSRWHVLSPWKRPGGH